MYSMYMSLDTPGCLRLSLQPLTTAHTSQLVIFLEFSCARLFNLGVLELECVLPSPTIHGFREFGLKASYFTKYIISLPCPSHPTPSF